MGPSWIICRYQVAQSKKGIQDDAVGGEHKWVVVTRRRLVRTSRGEQNGARHRLLAVAPLSPSLN